MHAFRLIIKIWLGLVLFPLPAYQSLAQTEKADDTEEARPYQTEDDAEQETTPADMGEPAPTRELGKDKRIRNRDFKAFNPAGSYSYALVSGGAGVAAGQEPLSAGFPASGSSGNFNVELGGANLGQKQRWWLLFNTSFYFNNMQMPGYGPLQVNGQAASEKQRFNLAYNSLHGIVFNTYVLAGYQVVKTPRTMLTLFAGPQLNVTSQTYLHPVTNTRVIVFRNWLGLQAGLGIAHQLSAKWQVSARLGALPIAYKSSSLLVNAEKLGRNAGGKGLVYLYPAHLQVQLTYKVLPRLSVFVFGQLANTYTQGAGQGVAVAGIGISYLLFNPER